MGAIISSFVPIHVRGRILPNYAMIDHDDKIPFWQKVGEAVHRYDCKYILQLSHGGRQRDVPGVENLMNHGQSSTDRSDTFHGLPSEAMSVADIKDLVERFAEGARRARLAGLDGVELHASHGYLFTQFLSSAINRRKDEYGGSLENRARFLLDVIRAIRERVGNDFRLQVKINAVDANKALYPWERKGTRSRNPSKSASGSKPRARTRSTSLSGASSAPAASVGRLPGRRAQLVVRRDVVERFTRVPQLYALSLQDLASAVSLLLEPHKKDRPVEAVCAPEAKAIRESVGIPVLTTGGLPGRACHQTRAQRRLLRRSDHRPPLIANNHLPQLFASGKDLPEKPCTFCNRCLINAIANPLGCYDVTRFESRDEMIAQVMSVFHPTSFEKAAEELGSLSLRAAEE